MSPVHYSRFGPEAARAWAEAALPALTRWIVLGIGIIAVLSSMIFSPAVPCTPQSPCRAADVNSFGVFLGLALLSFIGIWLLPIAGALVGIAAAVVDLIWDPAVAGRVGFAVYALACLHLATGLRRARRRQQDLLADVGRARVPAGSSLVLTSGCRLWSTELWLGCIAAAALALVSLGLYANGQRSDDVHRSRAVEVTGTVTTGWNGDGVQRVSVGQGGLPADLWISGSGEIERGEQIRFRVDPTDPEWTELPFDPPDHSWWLTLAVLFGGAALAGAWLGARRRLAGSTEERPDVTGLEMDAAVHASGDVLLRPSGGHVAVAHFRTGPPEVATSSTRRRRRLDWTPGVVLGDLCEGGWVQVRTSRGAITAGTPLAILASGSATERATELASERIAKNAPRRMAKRTEPRWVAWRAASAGPFFGLAGAVLAVSFGMMLPDAYAAAEGAGVSGTAVIVSEHCGKSCSYEVDYRSDDGRFSFQDVPFTGSRDVGSTHPAVYVGSGERPDEIFEPGSGDFWFDLVVTLVGAGVAIWHGAQAWPSLARRLRRR